MPKALSPHVATAYVLQHVAHAGFNLPAAIEKVNCKKISVVQAYSYNVVRYWQRLEFRVNRYLQKPFKDKDFDLYCLLLLGCYLLEDSSTADHAAINETVNACVEMKKPWAKNLLNAILRNLQRNRDDDEAAIAQNDTARCNHPQWLIDKIRAAWPAADQCQTQADAIMQANLQQAPMSLRVNSQKISRADYLQKLQRADMQADACQHSEVGLRLHQPCDVKVLPGFTEGEVSVQDEAAQLAAILLNPQAGEVILDACAAPGGKTLHILERCPDIQKLVAVDSDPARVTLINDNLNRLMPTRKAEVELHTADVATLAKQRPAQFDAILLDAPCSATGVIRRHPDIKLLRRNSDIKQLVSEQARLLDALWLALKPGGRMLYCTCSLLPEENQLQINTFLSRQNDVSISEFDVTWGHAVTPGGRQILPGEDAQDGFYYCLLQKNPA